MASRMKEDEKNEKIIRGLMKLPSNRRCINCNNLGPQYVCTNFWTFICTPCSGIHREFTHRVKSVSMAKFTAQEVAALQAGGNQRAKEIYFAEWDPQRNLLPDCSNIERLRDFIKNVYVDRRYAGGRAGDRPPKGKLGDRDEIYQNRRPDSYHSDSRSPPYEVRYEDHRYGEHPGPGVRKVQSDRGCYDDKTLRYGHDERKSPGQYGSERGRNDRGYYDNFQYDNNYKRSPGRFELDRSRYEDKFANEGPDRRFEDRSTLDSRDRQRLNDSSPNYQRNFELASPSPPIRPVRDILGDDVPTLRVGDFPRANGPRDTDGSARSQRTASSSSIGSSDGNSLSLKRVNSATLIDFNSEPQRPTETIQQDPFAGSSFPQPATRSAATVQQDPFAISSFTQPSSGHDATLQQDPFTVSSFAQSSTGPHATVQQDSFAASSTAPVGTLQEDPFTVNLFLQPSTTPSSGDAGWAKFDFAYQGSQGLAPAPLIQTVGVSAGIPDAFGPSNKTGQWTGQWLPVQQVNVPTPAVSGADNLAAVPLAVQPLTTISSSQSWNAFSTAPASMTSATQQNVQTEKDAPKQGLHKFQTTSQQGKPPAMNAEDKRKEIREDFFKPEYPEPVLSSMGLQWGSQLERPASGSQSTSAGIYQLGPTASYIQRSKSTNPFDLPDDPPAASIGMFPSMGSLQAALPNPVSTPGSFLGGPNSVWHLAQAPATYPSAATPGMYMGQQTVNSLPQIMQSGATPTIGNYSTAFPGDILFSNLGGRQLPSQSSLSSFGGNPFG